MAIAVVWSTTCTCSALYDRGTANINMPLICVFLTLSVPPLLCLCFSLCLFDCICGQRSWIAMNCINWTKNKIRFFKLKEPTKLFMYIALHQMNSLRLSLCPALRDNRIELVHASWSELTISISDVTLSDEGMYTCSLFTMPVRTAKAYLTVLGKNSIFWCLSYMFQNCFEWCSNQHG